MVSLEILGPEMNRKPLSVITDGDIRSYNEEGVVCLRQMFDNDWVERMRNASFNYMEQDTGSHRKREAQIAGEESRFYINTFMSVYDPEFEDFRDHSPAAEIGATLMEADSVRYWYDQLFIKDPGTTAPTQWHHDLPFWPLLGEDIVSIWLALTPVSEETSGLQYIAGSHKWGKFYCPVTPDEDPAYNNPDMESCPDYSQRKYYPDLKYLSWDLEPGDCICHHPLTVHGAGANNSPTQARAAISIRYLGEDVTWDPRPNVMKLPEPPNLKIGVFPNDDKIFPVVWEKA
jgi:ectoine hydroxylase-related dioxygenase (phytanoyl-CoA dioxygenase family)